VVAMTKADLAAEVAEDSASTLSRHLGGRDVRVVSAESGQGVDELTAELMALVNVERARAAAAEPEDLPIIRPPSEERFTVARAGDGRFVVEGYRPVTFVQMMDTGMAGAQDEIIRRLERWGIAKALRQAGAERGDTIVFGEIELTWEG